MSVCEWRVNHRQNWRSRFEKARIYEAMKKSLPSVAAPHIRSSPTRLFRLSQSRRRAPTELSKSGCHFSTRTFLRPRLHDRQARLMPVTVARETQVTAALWQARQGKLICLAVDVFVGTTNVIFLFVLIARDAMRAAKNWKHVSPIVECPANVPRDGTPTFTLRSSTEGLLSLARELNFCYNTCASGCDRRLETMDPSGLKRAKSIKCTLQRARRSRL